MNHQVLARKYRPRSFKEMVGQEHVLRALINALDRERLHPAYAFSGTRGVGKTTIARILSKCLNCIQGISSQACGQCTNCQAIDEGRFIDLLEIDAASKTRVEDTRELLENVYYPPNQGRYKIYLIDEAHMLSGHSFNALLKTLEEPPETVKFLFATTEPQKIPATILSRCLQFHLKCLPPKKIEQQLAKILQAEHIDFELPALSLLAKSAQGSLRDALSLLDQAIAYSEGKIKADEVEAMLGTLSTPLIIKLIEAVADKNTQALNQLIDQLAENVLDFDLVLEAILELLHQVAKHQALNTASEVPELNSLIHKLSPEDVQLFYQIALMGRKDLPLAPSPQVGFEITLVRMLAFSPVSNSKPQYSKTADSAEKNPKPLSALPNSPPKTISESSTNDSQKLAQDAARYQIDWRSLITELKLTGLAALLARHCSLVLLQDHLCQLALDPSQAALRNPTIETRLQEALSNYFKKPMRLEISTANEAILNSPAQQEAIEARKFQESAHANLVKDQHIKAICDVFGAKIEIASVQTDLVNSGFESEL